MWGVTARRAKEAGPDAMRRGEIPPLYPVDVEYSTPSATVSIKNYDFISSFSTVGLYL
jgi:hypothetical protein